MKQEQCRVNVVKSFFFFSPLNGKNCPDYVYGWQFRIGSVPVTLNYLI